MITRLTGRIILFTVVGLPLSIVATVAAQQPAQNKPGCTLINPARPGQFISYEKTADKEVLLRLHNNTDCPITVETDEGDQIGIFRTLPNGEHLFVYIERPHDVPLLLHYLVQDRPHFKLPVPAYDWANYSNYAIPKGESVLFAVPLAYFSKRFDVLVPFTFDWEFQSVNMGSGGVAHRVYFLNHELPRSADRRKP